MKKILPFFLLFGIFGCDKEDLPQKKNGLLVDYSGFDGCRWVIESEGELFVPINLTDFFPQLKDSTKVKFSYREAPGGILCQVGPTIELVSLQEN